MLPSAAALVRPDAAPDAVGDAIHRVTDGILAERERGLQSIRDVVQHCAHAIVGGVPGEVIFKRRLELPASHGKLDRAVHGLSRV